MSQPPSQPPDHVVMKNFSDLNHKIYGVWMMNIYPVAPNLHGLKFS